MPEAVLPEPFAGLEALAKRWARPSEAERDQVRWAANAEDFATFYEAVMPRIEQILDHLAHRQASELDTGDRRLYYLSCAFAEATPHHELYRGSAQVPFSFEAARFMPLHGTQDSAAKPD